MNKSFKPGPRWSTHDSTETVERCPFSAFSVERCPISIFWVERCLFSTFFEYTGHCSTSLDFLRLYRTYRNFFCFYQELIKASWTTTKLGHHLTVSVKNHLSKTSAWAAAKYNRKCHKLEHRRFEQPGLSCWTYVSLKQTKNGYVLTGSLKNGYFLTDSTQFGYVLTDLIKETMASNVFVLSWTLVFDYRVCSTV